MAQDFENGLARNVGTSEVTLITSNSDDAAIGVHICNVHSTSVTFKLYIVRSSQNYHLQSNTPIPVGSSFNSCASGVKINLKSGDVLKIISDTASSLDVVASFIDEIST